MARPRNPNREGWPPNLREPRPGYFTYRSPITQREVGLGGDFAQAVRYAKRENKEAAHLRAVRKEVRDGYVHGVKDRRGLYEAGHIAAEAMLYDSVVGIYFLLQDDEIVYVGQSTDALRRLSNHRVEGAKQFNRVFLMQCQAAELARLEAMYIDKFKPKYNGTAPTVDRGAAVWRGTFTTALAAR